MTSVAKIAVEGPIQLELLARFGFTIAKKESRVESGHYKSETTLARSTYQRGQTEGKLVGSSSAGTSDDSWNGEQHVCSSANCAD